jgi:hypothetical protein
MSWQSYVDDQLMATKFVNHAVIAGHDGNIWAQSAGFTVSLTYNNWNFLCGSAFGLNI